MAGFYAARDRIMLPLLWPSIAPPFTQIKDGIKKGLEAVGKEAKLPFKLTHHVLKRTSITWMVRKGIPFDTIELLTNTTVATLKKHYSQHSPDLEEALGNTFSV